MKVNVVLIDDDRNMKEDSIIWELESICEINEVKFFEKSKEGINYIQSNVGENIIVLLDINFSKNEKDGYVLLPEIREISKLIPVILWSAVDDTDNKSKNAFANFINDGAFGFIKKKSPWEEISPIVERAIEHYKTSLDNTIEDWIIDSPEDKDKPAYFTAEGKSYSLNQIKDEIRKQTPIGKSFAQKLNKLTIDLLLRSKENLND